MALAEMLAACAPGSPEEALVHRIDFDRLPRHIAVIMDGNGRWAESRRLPRVEGHRAGIDAVRDTVETAARLGVSVLTLYAFSMENWKRPDSEVSALMGLLKRYLRLELNTLLKNDIRFRVIGQPERLSRDIQDELARAADRTRENRGMTFNIALSYGGRAEIVEAARLALRRGLDPDALDEATFSSLLYTAGQPDPDLLIRTSGEMRVSNFLLWQIAYAEIWVTEALWPDFRARHLLDAVVDYQKRDRRYGAIASQAVGAGHASGD
jgi:undecaprenyl diphosphate synthase